MRHGAYVSKLKSVAIAVTVLGLLVWTFMPAQPETITIEAPILAAGEKPAAKLTVPKQVLAAKPYVATAVPTVVTLTASEKNELITQLEDFDNLYNKLLKTEDDREAYIVALKNKGILKLIRKSVLYPTPENAKLQDQSVKFLMEAVQADHDAVAPIIREIVSDPTIENPSIPQNTRQLQAELKAEIIYGYTSLHPEAAGQIASMLPGRASQGIWRNVQDQQARNESESASLN